MSSDRTSSDETGNQSEHERWELAHSLTADVDVTLNGEYTDLTVSHIRPNADGGAVTEITLLDDDRNTFVVQATNDKSSIPVLTLPENEQVPVTSITAAQHGLLASTTARNLYGSGITDVNVDPTDTYPEERTATPAFDATSIKIIGECPKCDCLVAAKEERAICTSCGTWTPLDQWDAYYDTEDVEPNENPDSDDDLAQKTLSEAWTTDTVNN